MATNARQRSKVGRHPGGRAPRRRRQVTGTRSRAQADNASDTASPPIAQPRKLSRKARKRVEREGPSERELRDSDGNIAAECLGAPLDKRTPNWLSLKQMRLQEFISGVRNKEFKHVEMWEDEDPSLIPQFRPGWYGRRALVHLQDGSQRWVALPDYPWWDVEKIAYDLVYERQVDVSWHKPPSKAELSATDLALVAVGGGIFLIASIYLGLIKRKGLPMDQFQAVEFGQSRSEARKEGKTETTFADVAGLDSIIGELQEVVSFLQAPERFNKVGARPPKGLLLEGPPGTGKTLTAKAIAGEAGVPFYSMTGSEFVEIIVGVGAARVRDLFKRARVNAPCIIFVDEIDALGGKRAPAVFRGNEEREQTLNQLLTEMDGFSSDTGVIFIGATNRADLLDPALTRPGRFDRKVTVPKPGAHARQKILQIHASKTRVSERVDFFQLANDLPGFNGADLSNLVNEAALVALRRRAECIEQQDFYWAIDRIVDGAYRSRLPREGDAIGRVTVYEAGKAVAACLLRRRHGLLERIERVSIVPRTGEMSRTVLERRQDQSFTFPTKSRLLDRMQMMLAGRAAEEVVFGTASTLADRDLLDASQLARMVVTSFSLDESVGFTSFVDKQALSSRTDGALADLLPLSNVDISSFASKEPSHKEQQRVDERVQAIVKEQYDAVQQLLHSNKVPLRSVSDALYDKDQIQGDEVELLCGSAE